MDVLATEGEVAEADRHHLQILATGAGGEGLWRISLDTVHGWAPGASAKETQGDKGPLARLLST